MAGKIIKREITVECEFKGMKVISRVANEAGRDVDITTKLVTKDEDGLWRSVEGTAKDFILAEFKQTEVYKKVNGIIGQALI